MVTSSCDVPVQEVGTDRPDPIIGWFDLIDTNRVGVEPVNHALEYQSMSTAYCHLSSTFLVHAILK
jgi:hypothetical protein